MSASAVSTRSRIGSSAPPALVLALAVLAGRGRLSAQNLVSNGEFDTTVNNWEDNNGVSGSLTWDTLDHDSCGAASGSALAENTAAGADTGVDFVECLTGITPGDEYSFEAYFRFPTGQSRTGFTQIILEWFDSSADCSGNFVGLTGTGTQITTATAGQWETMHYDAATAPANAHSVWARVDLDKQEAGGTLQLRFDGVHVVHEHSLIFFDKFGSGSTCRWSSAVEN